MRILKRKQKLMKPNKFEGKRKYQIRTGHPERTFTRLKDLYEMLQCDPDKHGYVVTTFKEMNELTEMDVNMLSIMIHNGMILKSNTGGSPKFKYKWDTIQPTMDMATTLINKRLNLQKVGDAPENVVSESKPESKEPDTYVPGLRTRIPDMHATSKMESSIVVDSQLDNGIMTIRVNLNKFNVEEADVISAVMKLLVN